MNNGKVRIYDLSKELNLENKDILAVCERLEIAVKSHSSTISEEAAQRIREVAKTQRPKPPRPATSQSPQRSPQKPSYPPKRTKPRNPVVKKQQILEVRSNKHSGHSSSSPASPEPIKPTPRPSSANPRPNRNSNSSPETLANSAPSSAPNNTASLQGPPQRPGPPPSAQDLSPSQTVAAAPKPAEPPAKVRKPAAVSSPNRPVLRPKSTSPSAGKPSGAPSAPPSARPNSARPAPDRLRPDKPSSKKSDSGQAVVELRRPRPIRPVEAPKESEEAKSLNLESGNQAQGAETDDALLSPVDQLEKPRPRRLSEPTRTPNRKGKTWEEDDEMMDNSRKSAKAGGKAKKRPHIIGEDDDDFGDELDLESDAPATISLSLVRPPKPKSAQIQTKPTPTPTASRKPRSDNNRERQRRNRPTPETEQRPEKLMLETGMTVQQLSEVMVVPETEIIKNLFFKGIMATITQTLDIPTIELVAQEYGIAIEEPEQESKAKKTEVLDGSDLDNLHHRPPVVTVMGHVDHGKTTLLDAIRKTKVAQGEAGGITQHIGAYHVDVEHGDKVQQVVFLDTPGHEAFTAMRARGTRVTDIAILVVAADDGVRPQTIEAISHAKAAEVPLIVAVNKVDKEEAQPDRVKQELMEHGLVPEEWGGDTIVVPVSAIQGENLDTLLEMILLVAEVEELNANPDREAKGTIIEAHLDKARGPVASLLVQNGTLRVGDVLVAGSVFGKVRAMIDDQGHRVEEAGPSIPVEVLGLGNVPGAGEEFQVFWEEKEARSLAIQRTAEQRTSRLQRAMSSRRVTLNSLSAQAQEGELKELNLLLKADVQGSLEAILGALEQLPQKEVQLRTLLAAPGEITETDVDLAAASGAVILGFSTTLASGAKRAADEAGVDVREYDIIYKLLEDVQGAMEGMLEPELVEEPLGQAEVRALFPVGRGVIAGCYIQSGKVIRNCNLRVHRGKELLHTGSLNSLRRMKEDAKEVNSGYECGIGVDNFNSWQEGDIIETYRMVTKRRTLSV